MVKPAIPTPENTADLLRLWAARARVAGDPDFARRLELAANLIVMPAHIEDGPSK